MVVGAYREVHVAVLHRIRVVLVDKPRDHVDHGLDLLRRAGADVGVKDVKAAHLLDEGGGELLGDRVCRGARLVCAVDDLVIHVGEVLRKGDLIALVHKVAADDVKGQEGTRVAYVDLVIDGRSAHVHANLALLDGRKLLLLVRLRVVDEHWFSLVKQNERDDYTAWMRQTAQAAMPSRRPTKPRCSVVVALTPTWSGDKSIARARLSLMASM